MKPYFVIEKQSNLIQKNIYTKNKVFYSSKLIYY